MLRFDSVSLRQGSFTLSADFDVAAGARIAITGPSGAGKSTLINAVAGFQPLSAGQLLWQGQDISAKTPGARPLSLVMQEANLFPHLTAYQNVALGVSPNLRLTREDQDRCQAALERVGLAGMGARKPAQLSGGQQSRVALARVLVRQQPLLLLDEPFAALGPALRADMLDLVAEICTDTGASLLMVTHAPADARRIAEQTVLVSDGQAHPPVETQALFDNPPPALADYLG